MEADISQLKAAHHKLALLVLDDPAYLPVFERIDNEIQQITKRNELIETARSLAAHYKAVG